MKEEYNEFCLQLYKFLTKNNKYFKVANYEMDQYVYQSKHKRIYYDIIEMLLKNHTDFIPVIIA